ncbi:MAG: hypothetical protein AB1540_11605 [Bdellovibrionota bacterium]
MQKIILMLLSVSVIVSSASYAYDSAELIVSCKITYGATARQSIQIYSDGQVSTGRDGKLEGRGFILVDPNGSARLVRVIGSFSGSGSISLSIPEENIEVPGLTSRNEVEGILSAASDKTGPIKGICSAHGSLAMTLSQNEVGANF